jgi:hypothetical protein
MSVDIAPRKNTTPKISQLMSDVLIVSKKTTRTAAKCPQGFADTWANTLELFVGVFPSRLQVLRTSVPLALQLLKLLVALGDPEFKNKTIEGSKTGPFH